MGARKEERRRQKTKSAKKGRGRQKQAKQKNKTVKKNRARSKLEKAREKEERHKKLGCVGATKEDGKKS